MSYVDGFLVPVPESRLEEYRALASRMRDLWMRHGALQYVESVADDVKEGKWTDFYRAVDRKPGETVVFAFVIYKSREDRDAIMQKVMADPMMNADPSTFPFDGKRMVFGGFRAILGD